MTPNIEVVESGLCLWLLLPDGKVEQEDGDGGKNMPPPSPLHDSNHFHAQAPYLWEQSISAPCSHNREVVQPKMAKKVHLGSTKSTYSIFSVHILWPSFIALMTFDS